MKQAPVRLGPLALLLTVISICLTILAILTFTTARADLRLAEKYAETVQSRYALEKEGQTYLAAVNAGTVPAPEPDENGTRCYELEKDGFVLHITLRENGAGAYEPVVWRQEKLWEQKETIDNLWSGSFGKEG